MKKAFLFLFVVMFVLINVVIAGEAEIKGYEPGKYSALKSDIAKQLSQKIIRPLREEFSRIKDGQIEITVVGFADKTGISAENENLSKNRAEEVSSVLSEEFPTAHIIKKTGGDEADIRMVVVEWTVKLPLQNGQIQKNSAETKKLFSSLFARFVGIAIAIILIWIVVFVSRPKKSKKSVVLDKDQPSAFKEVVKLVEVSCGEELYSIPVTLKADGKWHSAIPDMSDPDKYLFGESLGDLVNMLRRCSKDKRRFFYGPKFENFAKKGIIKKWKIEKE